MNTGTIRIEAVEDIDEMKDIFYSSVDELMPAMDLSVNDDRGELGDVVVSDIEFRGDVVRISYEYDWSAYYGCDDMNTYEEEDGVITGVLQDGYWVFEHFLPPPRRSTLEEF